MGHLDNITIYPLRAQICIYADTEFIANDTFENVSDANKHYNNHIDS